LHQQLVLLRQAARRHQFFDRHAAVLERLDDHPRAEGRRLDQRAVDVGGARAQRGPDQQAAQVYIHQHRAIAVPPVERQQAVLARLLPGGLGFQVSVQVHALRLGRLVIFGRDGVVHEPGEDVAHAALPGLVAVQAGDDSAVHHTAHAGHFLQRLAEHHVADAGAHDHDHDTRLGDARCGHGHVRVHVGDRDGDARFQAHPGGGLGGQVAGAPAQRSQFLLHLGLDHVGQIRVQRREVSLVWEFAVLIDGLVTRRARVARLHAAQLPHHPVRRFDQPVGGAVDFRRFVEDLQGLAEEPLR